MKDIYLEDNGVKYIDFELIKILKNLEDLLVVLFTLAQLSINGSCFFLTLLCKSLNMTIFEEPFRVCI